ATTTTAPVSDSLNYRSGRPWTTTRRGSTRGCRTSESPWRGKDGYDGRSRGQYRGGHLGGGGPFPARQQSGVRAGQLGRGSACRARRRRRKRREDGSRAG